MTGIQRAAVEVIDDGAKFGADYGVEIRLEVHGAGTQLLPNVKKIMEAASHPGAVVCWNCNPDDTTGEGLAANFALVKDRLGKTIHIHDLTSSYPWRDFFALLKNAQYRGWTLLEEGTPTADPIRVMKYYRLAWKMLLDESR